KVCAASNEHEIMSAIGKKVRLEMILVLKDHVPLRDPRRFATGCSHSIELVPSGKEDLVFTVPVCTGPPEGGSCHHLWRPTRQRDLLQSVIDIKSQPAAVW